MSFQQAVRFDYGFGVPGELKYDGPRRAKPGFINSASAAYNIVGATAFTQPAAGGAVVAGGVTPFYGILANPKLYASPGTSAGGPLAPTLTLPNNMEAEFVEMGLLVISVPAACNIGDLIEYDTTTGALSTIPAAATFTGVVAITTGILTVSAITAGSTVGINTQLAGANVPAGTIVTGFLTGANGGNGTYSTNIITAVASTAMSTPNIPPAGKALVPGGVITQFAQTAAGGLALAKLTN